MAQDVLAGSIAKAGTSIDAKAIRLLTNDQIVIRLLNTISHLSRWLSPVHERERLYRAPHRNQTSVKALLLQIRDFEREVFPKVYATATQDRPDLDRLPAFVATESDLRHDREATALEVQAECRRLRQSTCSLLRSLPDVSWQRSGISRLDRTLTIRELAEVLVLHDQEILAELDQALAASGAREGIAEVSRASYAELQRLSPAPARD